MNLQINKNKALGLAKIGLLGVLLMGAPSCQDTLNEEVISRIGNDYMNTAKGIDDAVNAAYSSLRTWYGTERGNNFTIFGTDTYTNGADGGWKFMNTYTTQFDTQNGHVRELWDELYRGINTTNAVIDRAPAVTGMTEELKKQRIAEAKFIRAHHYFILTQLFGGVDLRLTETLLPTKEVTRSTIAAQYEAIIRDLTEAIPDLEASARASQYGRATRPAAEHLLGKVYLTKATSEAKAADDFSNAIPLFQNVINNYDLHLLPDFASVHQQGNEMNDEVIWSVQYTRDPLTNGGGNNSHVFFLMEYDVQPGMQRDVVNGRPFKRYMPTEYTLNEIFTNRDIDSRYKKSFKDVYYSNKPGTYNTSFDTTKPSVTFAEGDTAIYLPGYEMSAEERAKKPYQVLVPSRYDERLFPALTKHLDAGRVDRTQFEGGRDYIAFRLADTYLMLAEAQLQVGQTAEAVENINMVRRRAAWPGKESEMEITADQLDMEFIIEERPRELIGEQMRWLDLKRWGVLIDRVKAHNEAAAPNIQPHHVLRPIPQTQIDRSATPFEQNPGY
ncbi:RagB/SusD family nutrient uptake outer membrane protein [Pontibacter pamirensis]|uniref:RagB/SusD family nutrient uptake outer membrane protein n=1 Tax=Pontibacter pamirensis TaxID=2562824 RepID=UPI001389C3E0|nr:RagB/SusD family nutrient uptake outer membrane protein [Pontibacter pamirensis]